MSDKLFPKKGKKPIPSAFKKFAKKSSDSARDTFGDERPARKFKSSDDSFRSEKKSSFKAGGDAEVLRTLDQIEKQERSGTAFRKKREMEEAGQGEKAVASTFREKRAEAGRPARREFPRDSKTSGREERSYRPDRENQSARGERSERRPFGDRADRRPSGDREERRAFAPRDRFERSEPRSFEKREERPFVRKEQSAQPAAEQNTEQRAERTEQPWTEEQHNSYRPVLRQPEPRREFGGGERGDRGDRGYGRRDEGGRGRFGGRGDRGGRGGDRRERFGGRGSYVVNPPTPGELEHLRTLAAEATAAETGFSKLGLEPLLLGALRSQSFDTPTPIQATAIPMSIQGKDVLGCAQTGTGKTLAFLVPILNKLLQSPEGKGIILVPTRELGLQIEEVLKPLTKKIDLGLPVLLIGGVSYVHQFRSLEQKHRVIVATPGRLIDHLQSGKVQLQDMQFLVLDEADRMLDVGFKPQLNEILDYLPEQRQTMMFTATVSRDVKILSNQYLQKPEFLNVGETEKANENITQQMIEVSHMEKTNKMLDLLKDNPGTALMFVKTQIKTEKMADILEENGIMAMPIHGGLTQGQRKRAIENFRDEKVRVLVATDVAARGLDIDHVGLVINFDLPQVIEDYIHRIGRTGRAGRKGLAVSLVSGEDRGIWRMIARKYLGEKSGVSGDRQGRGGYEGRSGGGRGGYGRRSSGFQGRGGGRNSYR